MILARLASAIASAAILASATLVGPWPAHAGEVTCQGTDLMAAMARDEPERLAAIRQEAAGESNGQALLWRVERDGTAPSWLFGTMHVADPRVTRLPDDVRRAFEAADRLVIETTDIIDQTAMMASLAGRPELMMFTDDTTLASLLGDEDREIVQEGLDRRGIPLASVNRMKPWMLATMVALPACELERKARGQPVLDLQLAHSAQTAGKPVEGLESAVDQLAAMASLPLEFHLRGLVETMRLGDRVDDVMETMVAIYLSGEPALFWPFFAEVLPQFDEDAGNFAFDEAMITARNRTMADEALPFLAAGNSFVAVGALHLPGDEGLVALLREAGYRVTAQ